MKKYKVRLEWGPTVTFTTAIVVGAWDYNLQAYKELADELKRDFAVLKLDDSSITLGRARTSERAYVAVSVPCDVDAPGYEEVKDCDEALRA